MSATETPKSAKSLVVKKNSDGLPDWHVQQELILKRWSEIGSSYRYLHDKAFQKYTNQMHLFVSPVNTDAPFCPKARGIGCLGLPGRLRRLLPSPTSSQSLPPWT